MSTGLLLRTETPKGRVLSWYGEPFGRIYRKPDEPELWLGEYWDGSKKQTVWEPRASYIDAATLCLQKWTEATKTDLLAARYG